MGYIFKEYIKGANSDVFLFNCVRSRHIKRLSCNFILKPLVPSAKTEKPSKDTMLSQINIWSCIAEFSVDLIFLPIRILFITLWCVDNIYVFN